MITHQEIRSIALSLPGVEEAPCYGTPGFRIRKKLLARFHPDGESLVLAMDPDTREFVLRRQPEVFYLTDHYRNSGLVLVRLEHATRELVLQHLENSWRRFAPKRLVADYIPRE